MEGDDVANLDFTRETSRVQLGEASFNKMRSEGRAMPIEEALKLALRSESVSNLLAPESPVQSYPEGLTVREVEVVRLAAKGLTNKEIAARLSVSAYTVAAHMRSIHSKLGVSNSAEVTSFAFEHNLL